LAVAAGAAGVLSRHASFEETLAVVRRAGRGEALIEPDELHGLLRASARFRAMEESARAKFERLTARELDVLRALARGSSDKEIAAELRIKNKTVASHVANVLDKLAVSSRLQAVLLALQFDVVELGFE
jgi:DNA-binding NarL/FixJ family response regulator